MVLNLLIKIKTRIYAAPAVKWLSTVIIIYATRQVCYVIDQLLVTSVTVWWPSSGGQSDLYWPFRICLPLSGLPLWTRTRERGGGGVLLSLFQMRVICSRYFPVYSGWWTAAFSTVGIFKPFYSDECFYYFILGTVGTFKLIRYERADVFLIHIRYSRYFHSFSS